MEVVIKTSSLGQSEPSLADGEAALWVTKSQAIWLLGTPAGNKAKSKEAVQGHPPFLLRFSVSSVVPPAKARQQLREWGFTPRVVIKQPFNTFGTREMVQNNATLCELLPQRLRPESNKAQGRTPARPHPDTSAPTTRSPANYKIARQTPLAGGYAGAHQDQQSHA